MKKNRLLCSLGLGMCWMISGCIIGPQVKTEVVIVEPGKPVQIDQPTGKLKCHQLKDQTEVFQEMGGWIAMPESHWRQVELILEKIPEKKVP